EKLHVERAVLGAGGIVLRLGKVYARGTLEFDARYPDWRWTHIHVNDAASAAALAVEKAQGPRVYNVGERATPTQLERMRIAGIPVQATGTEKRPDLVLDSSRIRRELGWQDTPLERALGERMS